MHKEGLNLRGEGGGGGGPLFFPSGFGRKKIITNSYIYVYMSKCRQFQGLSTGMSILTIPNHTIKLQLNRLRHLIIKKKIHKKNNNCLFSCLSGVLVEWPQMLGVH